MTRRRRAGSSAGRRKPAQGRFFFIFISLFFHCRDAYVHVKRLQPLLKSNEQVYKLHRPIHYSQGRIMLSDIAHIF